MKAIRFICFCVFLLIGFQAQSQLKVTTVILVRHAEKMVDCTRDPELSPAGKERADRLKAMLLYQLFTVHPIVERKILLSLWPPH